ncbi:unnamed protein product [Protopolystoma xenopodis]|uniref:Uncharacterized protein n=1 Tax=Protopolystoma xenopodis TaxID=117903 RepID=A0A448WCU1_9PLAT|nr:unnamed protein product [Protopolystoma xenopodis]
MRSDRPSSILNTTLLLHRIVPSFIIPTTPASVIKPKCLAPAVTMFSLSLILSFLLIHVWPTMPVSVHSACPFIPAVHAFHTGPVNSTGLRSHALFLSVATAESETELTERQWAIVFA